MRHLKFFENFQQNPKPINLFIENEYYDEPVGSINGVIHYDISFINNWMNKEKIDERDQEIIRKKVKFPVAILYNINVDELYRNKGFGTQGIEEFLEEVSEVNTVLLIADTQERNNFNIISWYNKYGFEKISKYSGLPVMLLDNNIYT